MSHLIPNQENINKLKTQVQKLQIQRNTLKAQVQIFKTRNNKLRHRVELLSTRTPTTVNTLEYNNVESANAFYSNEKLVEKYHAPLQQSIYQLFSDILTEKIKIAKSAKVLDAGCGLGIFTNTLRERFQTESINGFDFSEIAIQKARSVYKKIDFFVHDIYDSLDKHYDIIVCTETLEHLADPEKAIKKLLSSLNTGGSLFMTVPDGRIDYSLKHINFWSPESWLFFVKKLSHKSFTVDAGIISHPTKATLRYNWAILTSTQDWN